MRMGALSAIALLLGTAAALEACGPEGQKGAAITPPIALTTAQQAERDVVGVWVVKNERMEFLKGGTIITNITSAPTGQWEVAEDGRILVIFELLMGGKMVMIGRVENGGLMIGQSGDTPMRYERG